MALLSKKSATLTSIAALVTAVVAVLAFRTATPRRLGSDGPPQPPFVASPNQSTEENEFLRKVSEAWNQDRWDREFCESLVTFASDASRSLESRTDAMFKMSARLVREWPVEQGCRASFESVFIKAMSAPESRLRMAGFDAAYEARILLRADVEPLAKMLNSDSDPLVARLTTSKLVSYRAKFGPK